MTNEEAIKTMYSILKFYSYITPNKEFTAINMAIEALQAKADGDLISRQGVVNEIDGWIQCCTENDENAGIKSVLSLFKEHIEHIKSLPSADRPTGECRTCGRNADNGGVHEDGRTKCPIQEHYALLLDGYCHLYELYDCGAEKGESK